MLKEVLMSPGPGKPAQSSVEGYIAIPARPDVVCRCGASTSTSEDAVMFVADRFGSHLACRRCGETWNHRTQEG